MLRHIEEFDAAESIEKAMLDVYADAKRLRGTWEVPQRRRLRGD